MEHWHRSGQALLNEISTTRLPASQLAVWSIGQCGFIFKYEDTVVCIDPVLSDLTGPSGSRRCYPAPFAPEALRADLVLCTHGHADHMAKDTLRGLARHPAARFVLPAGCSALAAEYGIPADRITTVQEGSILPLGGVTVRAFSAAHPEHILDAGDPGMALGYQLTFGGFTVVHLGDTYLTPHLYETLQALPRPDLLLAPINGQDFFRTQRNCIGNLEAEEAGWARPAPSPPTTTWCRATPWTRCGSLRPCVSWTPPPVSPCLRWANGCSSRPMQAGRTAAFSPARRRPHPSSDSLCCG